MIGPPLPLLVSLAASLFLSLAVGVIGGMPEVQASELGEDRSEPEPDRQPLPPSVAVLPPGREGALQMLQLVAERRSAFEVEWAQRERDCYRRFLVNPCLNTLRLDRLAAERQFDALAVGARQALRDDAARERNRREAERMAREP
jgi:colicin import membrane protein